MTKPALSNSNPATDAASTADTTSTDERREARSPNQLVVDHRHLVNAIAHMYKMRTTYTGRAEFDEILSEGMLALVESAHRYDATRGVGFVTFAWYRIRGAMLNTAQKGRRMESLVRIYARERTAELASDDALNGTEPDVSEDHLQRSLERLPTRHRMLLEGHLSGRTLSDVGRDLGISKYAACRGYHTAINRMRADVGVDQVA
jgi:RNA polymerase sigma factor (sigma-70 family)